MDPKSTAELADGFVGPLRAGWFNFYFADERWEWSPEVARIHGYEPGTVTPTTDLVMRHKHPDDRPKVAAALDHVRRTHEAISTRHRIVDTKGHTREVIVLGEHLCDDTGAEVGIHGFYVDVTPTHRNGSGPYRAYDQLVNEAASEIAEFRGPIEQVKGVLMFVYRIDEEQAFGLLKWRSQETNVKLRALAVQLAADILDLDYDENLPRRSSIDRLLMTAHLRASPAARLRSRDERPRC